MYSVPRRRGPKVPIYNRSMPETLTEMPPRIPDAPKPSGIRFASTKLLAENAVGIVMNRKSHNLIRGISDLASLIPRSRRVIRVRLYRTVPAARLQQDWIKVGADLWGAVRQMKQIEGAPGLHEQSEEKEVCAQI